MMELPFIFQSEAVVMSVATILFLLPTKVVTDQCVQVTSAGNTHYKSCQWGCCYAETEDPCCEPFYIRAPFVIGVIVGVIVFISFIVIIIAVCRLRANRSEDCEARGSYSSTDCAPFSETEPLPPPYVPYQGSFDFDGTEAPEYPGLTPSPSPPPSYTETMVGPPPPYKQQP